jgi:hypothetical protein
VAAVGRVLGRCWKPPAFEAVAAEHVRQPNLDSQQAAAVALRVAERLREPGDRRAW